MPPRVSQRQTLACRECTQKKRKCSKEIPCVRCRRLGLHCTREVVRLRRAVSQNGRELAFLDGLREELAAAEALESSPLARARVGRALQQLTERVQLLQSGGEGGGGGSGGGAAQAPPGGGQGQPPPEAPELPPADANPPPADTHDSLIVTALEHVAWGRNSGSCYPHRRCTCQYNNNSSSSALGYAAAPAAPFSPVAARIVAHGLPGRALSEALVQFHLDHMAWHHNCVHAPTFRAQCRRFWESGGACYDHPQWLALYLSVLSTAQFCLLHSRRHYASYGASAGPLAALSADPGAPCSAQALFQAMLDVLHASQYLQNVSLYAVQAIVVSTEVAHNLGLSQLNATLMASAVRIAECLGVHKIEDDPGGVDAGSDDDDVRIEKLEREVGRRVWLQMVVQDHFAMPFTDAYGIHPQQYATGVPRNCDDTDAAGRMVEQPDSLPTVSSYTRVLATLARLVPELADGLGPLRARKPLRAQYEHILAMDQKMRRIVRAIPPYFLRQDPLLEAQVPWLGIARQSMAITAAEKIIMVHRPFLFRAFQAAGRAAYAHTRRTCVSAAMTILREHRNITDSGEVSLWTHTAFCITAALLLSFEVLCSQPLMDDPEVAAAVTSHRSAILYARTYLASRTHDILAQRGVLLIDALFPGGPANAALAPTAAAAASAPAATGNIRFEDIVSNFTAGWAMMGLSMELQQQQQQQQSQAAAAAAAAGFLGPATLATPQPQPQPQPVFVPETTDEEEEEDDDAVYGDQAFPDTLSPSLEDFDVWFQHLFTTGQSAAFV